MNIEYLEKLFEENKEKFEEEEGLDIMSVEDLKDMMIYYIISNMQYDFDIDIEEEKLFKE